MNVSEERERDLVAQEAADWYVANREGLDEGQRAEFARWLKRSPAHLQEYLEATVLARDLRQTIGQSLGAPKLTLDAFLERARAADDGSPDRIEPRVRERRHVRLYALAAAIATVVIAGLAVLIGSGAAPQTTERFATRHGEQRTQRLADASVLHLNTDTAVVVHYSRSERKVNIERGQAVFEVAHDTARPFRVVAGSAEVVAVGTQFDVYLEPGATRVTVIEGRVTVGPAPKEGWLTRALEKIAGPAPTYVVAGQQVRVVDGVPSSPMQVQVQHVCAWLRREIEFEQWPLASVAAEFNRYTATPIDIETPALRELMVSGAFAADDTESFIAFLRSIDGVRVQITPTRIAVSKP
jgi:transmembrane sensor